MDDTPVPVDDPKPQGKGRPTPKRRDAEGRRRQPVTAPKDRKEAYQQAKVRQAAERERARKGMLAGDERYFPARDKGPARKFARDWVDSRRLPSQYFLPFSLLILLATWVPWPADIRPIVLSYVITIGWPIMMIGVLFTSVYVAWRVKKLVAEKHPNESLRGVGFYAAMRALQIRKLRFPPPAVLPGGKPVPPKK
ncbi:DUF3043 domain-containing protein [Nonomuraea sp. NPDC005983]|uniref:DUF3043 domain-containing protein n=1 Tax=Nonomuraea sp. NPDC005983 TaxID=3155595 RepID=UPI0033B64561